MQLAEGIVLAIAAVEIATAQEDCARTTGATHWRFLPPVQVRDEYPRPEGCAAVPCCAAQPSGSAVPRAEVAAQQALIRRFDAAAELIVRKMQIGSAHVYDARVLLLQGICERYRSAGHIGTALVFTHA